MNIRWIRVHPRTILHQAAFEDARASVPRASVLLGQILAMAGESRKHGVITVNIVGQFYLQLRGTSCETHTKDAKVRSGPKPTRGENTRVLFSYPDILVVCGEPKYHDAHTDVILNPTVIVEVLSRKTEAFDRGTKFDRYQTWNPSLREYLLVSQDQPQIEHFSRRADGLWIYQRHVGLKAAVVVPSIKCTLQLADVYDRVKFGKKNKL